MLFYIYILFFYSIDIPSCSGVKSFTNNGIYENKMSKLSIERTNQISVSNEAMSNLEVNLTMLSNSMSPEGKLYLFSIYNFFFFEYLGISSLRDM